MRLPALCRSWFGSDASASLTVLLQHLIAGAGDAGAVLLQAGQHGGIAGVHVSAAEAGDVARAGIMALLVLRGGSGSKHNERNDEKQSGHDQRL